jgi:exodeoxyribonuclease-5
LQTSPQEIKAPGAGMMLVWSPDQERALRKMKTWLAHQDSQIFKVYGFAGTGKTTLARQVTEWCNFPVKFCAPTGKAAQVLRQKGCDPVSTLHKLIYQSSYNESIGRFRHELKPKDELAETLIVVDEASMVDWKVAHDLLSFGTLVLVLLDPAQLPPVSGGSPYFANGRPNVFLKEIHRQARDNPILALADQVRRKKMLPLPGYDAGDGAVRIVRDRLPPDDVDAVLVGLNPTRHHFNDFLRRRRGFRGPLPQVGETLVCLRNDYSVQEVVYNGTLWEVRDTEPMVDRQPPLVRMRLVNDLDETTTVKVPCSCLDADNASVPYGLQNFDFGYVLTVHKAQGSEWPNVALMNQSRWFTYDRYRWLYTGITRAEKTLTIFSE